MGTGNVPALTAGAGSRRDQGRKCVEKSFEETGKASSMSSESLYLGGS